MPFASSRSPMADGWPWLLVFALLCLVGGVLAFVHPFAASLTVVSLAALSFIVAGILKAVYAARIRETGAFIISLLIAALFILLGFGLWANPLAGLVSLTVMVAVLFVLIGAFKIIFALRLRALGGSGWVLVSGLVSVLLGAMILANFPEAAATILGLLLGVELLSTGIAFAMAAMILRGL
ncbi:MAG: HdeD family acid-resistance protein [Rhodobacteraceae bacterium]|nr:HdeD family acid-resistance protein [Paracoccaceae bacterium]